MTPAGSGCSRGLRTSAPLHHGPRCQCSLVCYQQRRVQPILFQLFGACGARWLQCPTASASLQVFFGACSRDMGLIIAGPNCIARAR